VRACYPLGPIFEGTAINITVMSYCDSVGIGVVACPRTTSGTAAIAAAFESNTARLLRLVARKPPRRKPARSSHAATRTAVAARAAGR